MADEHRSRVVANDYRLTRTNEGLRIEVLDYHAEPLLLTPALLRELGLRFLGETPAHSAESSLGQGTRPTAQPDV